METDDRLGEVADRARIMRFALPSIIMMASISSYTLVDGALVSHYVGTDALAAVNIALPAMSVLSAFGFMLSTGGSALAGKLLGEGRVGDARAAFSGIVATGIAVSLVAGAAAILWPGEITGALGADGRIGADAASYLMVSGMFAVFFVLQFVFTEFLVVSGRPNLALAASLAGGLANVVLDVAFMGGLGWGVSGSAAASGIGAAASTAIPLLCFISDGRSPIRFARPSRDPAVYAKVCSNGASEMVGELSGGITGALFNLSMMAYAGPDGVAALTIVMYSEFMAIAVIAGYSMGTAPLMSYSHGAGRRDRMNLLFRTGLAFTAAVGIIVFAALELLAPLTAELFASGSPAVSEMAEHGTRIFAFAFLFLGTNCFASSLFTSLNNGLLSATVSFARGLCVLSPAIALLPLALGTDGIWLAVPVTEAVVFAISVRLMLTRGERFGYLRADRPASRRDGLARPRACTRAIRLNRFHRCQIDIPWIERPWPASPGRRIFR